MRARSRLAAGIAASVIVFGLAGCAGQPADSATTPSSVASETPRPTPTMEDTPTPTPTAAPIDSQDPSTWVVTDAGMGPVSLGQSLADALAAMPDGTRNDAETCAWTAWWNAPDGRYQVYASREGDAGEDGPVTIVESSMLPESTGVVGPLTPEGIGVGSTLEEVQAAYPGSGFSDTSIGGRRFIEVSDTIFLTFYEGVETVSAVTVTEADAPPYEVCG